MWQCFLVVEKQKVSQGLNFTHLCGWKPETIWILTCTTHNLLNFFFSKIFIWFYLKKVRSFNEFVLEFQKKNWKIIYELSEQHQCFFNKWQKVRRKHLKFWNQWLPLLKYENFWKCSPWNSINEFFYFMERPCSVLEISNVLYFEATASTSKVLTSWRAIPRCMRCHRDVSFRPHKGWDFVDHAETTSWRGNWYVNETDLLQFLIGT